MTPATLLRRQIELTLESRFPAALTPVPRTVRETVPSGVAAVDALLEGGFPVGAISEVVGPESSGRTSLALATVAGRTRAGQVCAWVDAGDALDPESAASSGVLLAQLLWVRCEQTGVAKAGTGAQQTKRRATRLDVLDQALRAADLLLQAGGFAAIVLDLGGIAVEDALRIPLATWFRFRQAADRARSCLLVLGRASYAQSSAATVLDCASAGARSAGGRVLRGFEYGVSRKRQRFAVGAAKEPLAGQRKPVWRTWRPASAWAVEERA
jgi:hypothetical protein